jgi:hypothetical protein
MGNTVGRKFSGQAATVRTRRHQVILFFLNFYFIHMCIQRLGHFSPLPPAPSLTPPPPSPPLPPHYPAETILPLSLILLKREYKQ